MSSAESAWRFYCGVCTKALTDATALFTSCGHFFCADSDTCTQLKPGTAAGRCEQCSNHCDAGLLDNKGARYDDRLRQFVFKDLQKDLKTIADILDFRNTHLSILGENTASQTSRIAKLKAENVTQTKEISHLRSDIEKLRTENNSLRTQLARLKYTPTKIPVERSSQAAPAALSRVPSVEIIDGSSNSVDPLRIEKAPREVARYAHSHGRQAQMQQSNTEMHRYQHARTDPSRRQSRDILRYDQLRPKAKPTRQSSDTHWKTRAQAVGSSADPRAMRPSKRRWETLSGPSLAIPSRPGRMEAPQVPAKRSRRMEPSVVTASRAPRSIPRFSSSKTTGISGLSRFARGAGSNYLTGSAVRGPTSGQIGDWQRKVSTVPRPSATPDRLGRNQKKKSRQGANPLAGW